MTYSAESKAAIAIVRRNIKEVQGKRNMTLFEELWADDAVGHTCYGPTGQL
jgi:hypothetical protein